MTGTWIDIILYIFIGISLLLGTFILISASIGVIRFPDVYTRLHAASKAATLGVSGILIAAFIFMYVEQEVVSGKLLLGIVFIMLTAPVAGHMIGKAAYKSGVPLSEKSGYDEWKEHMETKQQGDNR
ncbi:monovalent cation/H(+) antiporter subunit G [Halobacillus sp. Marseille-Q1614]|uniref:monovalent cation/H(+) antiporter subunit G n=1 Tax=Halobacillus sp. Marseille-Q1614 TaxID=2709134 RepID=UPI00156E93C7|nr:monovalent cation/H(+) antiporter subunit G [Halobacillus sp. Marseille-Q1614]